MSPRRPAGDRIHRMLAMVPWIVARPGVAKTDVAATFGISLAELEQDLALMSMIGVQPETPDRMVEVLYEGDTVEITLPQWFARPPRLTADEALMLVAAGRALLEVEGSDPDGPLARAVAKLEAAVGAPGPVAIDLGDPEWIGPLRAAVAEDRQVEIHYRTPGKDARTRVIDPYAVFFSGGRWYVDAWCHDARDGRVFRLDRIEDCRVLDTTFARPTGAGRSRDPYRPRGDEPEARLHLSPAGGWVLDTLPVVEVQEAGDGGYDVRVAVSDPAFLEPLLLRLGDDAEVLAPPELRSLRGDAARRTLRRYELRADDVRG